MNAKGNREIMRNQVRFFRNSLAAAVCVAAAATAGAAGNPWRQATVPAGLENAAPFDLDMASATEAWLVGVEIGDEDVAPPVSGVALHLSGGSWTRETPPTVTANWALYAVSCTPDGTWFAGNNALADIELEDPFAKESQDDPAKQDVTTAGVTLFRPNNGAMAVVINEINAAILAAYGFGMSDAWFAATSTTHGLSSSGWSQFTVNGMESVYDIAFPDSNDGWAVGASGSAGAAAHYDGAAWTAVTLPEITSPWELQGVSFPSTTEGWAVGQVQVTTAKQTSHYEGVILHYASGVWSIVAPPVVSGDWYLEDVCFPTASEGWAVGTNLSTGGGVVLHYSSGSWKNETPDIPGSSDWSLACVSFWDAAHGWAAGYDNSNETFLLLKYRRGTPEDINNNGEVNAIDVQIVINAALGLEIGDQYYPDVDDNGNVNAVDIQKVINAALGIGNVE